MKNARLLIISVSLVTLNFMVSLPAAFAQEALKQLNNETSSAITPTLDKQKLKETMSPSEFKRFEGAKSYVDANGQYTFGPDDVLTISVLRHPEVSGEYIINKDGKIQYEFIGDVVISGLTKNQAVNMLTEKLAFYIIKPQVTLKIKEYNSKIVYVVGEVANPGKIPMRGDVITVRDALLAAGLPLIGSAATDSASIFTPSASGKVVRKKVNVEALLYKGDLRENYILHPGDCLYVPATFLTKAMRAISPVTAPVENAASGAGAAKYAF